MIRFFIDMDGVGADFIGGFEEAFRDKPSTIKQWMTRKPDGKFPNFMGVYEMTREEFYARIEGDRRFWHELPVVDGFGTMVNNLISQAGIENVFIATAPTSGPGWGHHCLPGKQQWVERVLPCHEALFTTNFITIKRKEMLCRAPTDVLIDDFDKNVYAWIKTGGTGILFPQPWTVCHHLEFFQKLYGVKFDKLDDFKVAQRRCQEFPMRYTLPARFAYELGKHTLETGTGDKGKRDEND